MELAISPSSLRYLSQRDTEYQETFWKELRLFFVQLEYYFRHSFQKDIAATELEILKVIHKTMLYFRPVKMQSIDKLQGEFTVEQVQETAIAKLVLDILVNAPGSFALFCLEMFDHKKRTTDA